MFQVTSYKIQENTDDLRIVNFSIVTAIAYFS